VFFEKIYHESTNAKSGLIRILNTQKMAKISKKSE
jgi:hypothetical protein